ncbi:MAG: sugar transferase [Anaerolineae bacterium]
MTSSVPGFGRLIMKDHFLIFKDCLKRLFDICFSSLVLVALLPLYILIALAIKISSTGPIFFGSRRLGKGGKLIICWKFRTMCQDAEEVLATLLEKDPSLKKEWSSFAKLKHDPRTTMLGKYLRRFSIDELPQFWNVLKGDLSIVGPRPYLVEEIQNQVGEKSHKILSVRPGITGVWQISGRSNLTLEQRITMEADYVDNRGFFKDLILIFKTFPCLFFPRGAY